jgi:acyl carrier protein phosphodiesterase
MNHLAHLFLADDTPESLLGNLSGDFVKGRLGDQFPPAVRAGIVEHRKVDEFTDTHPEVAAFRRIIAADHGHYARVIADVFFDHFLAAEWRDFHPATLEVFLAGVWAKLDPLIDLMPPRLRRLYPRIRDEQWLLSYREPGGIHTALTMMSFRFSRKPHLETAVRLLEESGGALRFHFRRFLPDVIDHVRAIRSRS